MTTELNGAAETTPKSMCAAFSIGDEDWHDKDHLWKSLMRCPECSGWLPRYFPIGEQFHCKRCGAVLETLPDEDEDPDMEQSGRLCIVPEEAITIAPFIPLRRVKTKVKKTTRIAMGLCFVRRVWRDRDQFFINVNGERIYLDDVRIDRIIEEADQ